MDRASRMSQVAMYADTAHFVYEILQNADDVEATEIHFKLSADQLVIEHNGTPFTDKNVEAISYFGKGKTDITKIGHFGLGFKSVFAYTASPRVYSGQENFEITVLYSVASAPYPSDLKRGRTRFVLPFDHIIKKPDYIEGRKLKSAKKAYEEIATKLANLGGDALLFTKSLIEIQWETEEIKGHYLREGIPIMGGGREVYIITDGSEDRYYLLFDRTILWPDENNKYVKHRPVQIAFSLNKRLNENGAIKMVEDAHLFVFFPTYKESHVGFILQGPYRTTPARDNVPEDDDFNQHLVKETAALLKNSLANIKELGLLNLDTLATLPINHEKFKEGSFFHPLHTEVRSALANQPLLPTASRGFVSGLQAKLARGAELTKVFGPSQLDQLFGKPGLKWLDPELTKDNYQELHRFLVGTRNAQYWHFKTAVWSAPPIVPDIEVAAEQIAKLINAEFMSQQTDQWVLRFYEYLSGSSGHLNFVDRPIIRLEGDKHVVPFDKSDNPNAFLPTDDEEDAIYGLPIVKRALVQGKKTRVFLEEDIGLTKPDLADLVIKRILPKYAQEGKTIDTETCRKDFRKIRQALQTDSAEKKNRLLSALSDASIVLTVKPLDESKVWRSKPEDAYSDSKEMKTFFHGVVEKYFLAPGEYDGEDMRLLLELGVADSPRVTKRMPNYRGYVTIQSGYGWHKRGLDGFDPDWKMDGVENVVKAPTLTQSQLLWEYLLPHAACIQGIVEKSSRQTFEDARRDREISGLGKLLIDSAWLPDKEGNWHKPNEIFLTDLPDKFDTITIRAKEVAEKLGMKKTVSQETIGALGFCSEEELRRAQKIIRSPELLREFEEFQRRKQREAQSKSALPDKISPNPERREGKIAEEARSTPEKTRETRDRTVDPEYGGAQSDAKSYLKHQYTNDDGVMFCQLCQTPQPVLLNREPYFEAVDCVGGINAHHEQNNLALCPNHAAMYKNGGLIPDGVQRAILECEGQKIPLNLAGNMVELYFTQQHLSDLRAILANVCTGRD